MAKINGFQSIAAALKTSAKMSMNVPRAVQLLDGTWLAVGYSDTWCGVSKALGTVLYGRNGTAAVDCNPAVKALLK